MLRAKLVLTFACLLFIFSLMFSWGSDKSPSPQRAVAIEEPSATYTASLPATWTPIPSPTNAGESMGALENQMDFMPVMCNALGQPPSPTPLPTFTPTDTYTPAPTTTEAVNQTQATATIDPNLNPIFQTATSVAMGIPVNPTETPVVQPQATSTTDPNLSPIFLTATGIAEQTLTQVVPDQAMTMTQQAILPSTGGGGGYGGGGGGGGGGYGGEIPPAPYYDGVEVPQDVFFQDYGVNPFVDTDDDNLSTFAMDVDTASFTLARTYLTEYAQLPPPEAIRPEEFINYFPADYAPPTNGADFAFALEAADSPFSNNGHYLLRVGVQGRVIDPQDREPVFLVFVIDVSGSMSGGSRLETVKSALNLLLDQLRPDDYVGIVIYTDTACTLQMPVSASEKSLLSNQIGLLQPQNSTNADAGLQMGYDMAESFASPDRQTRVVLLSDGVANVDTITPEGILARIQDQVDLGITLTSIGVGMGNYNDVLLEQLANDGDGNYYYVDNLREAERVFVNNLTGTLQLLARDAKIQVEFNPETVEHYRLIGYENRDVADEDFRNNEVDAGEIGVGHSITALYEVALNYNAIPEDARIATVSLRYEQPETGTIVEMSESMAAFQFRRPFEESSATFQLQAYVAEFAELLRQSYWAKDSSFEHLWEYVRQLPKNPTIQDFFVMLTNARSFTAP